MNAADAAPPPTTGPGLAPGLARLTPGLAIVLLGVAVAHIAGQWVALSALTIAVLLGAVVENAGLLSASTRPGTHFTAKRLLRIGVVLLGFRLAVVDIVRLGGPTLLMVVVVVALTFFGTQWMGRRLGLSPALALLVASGFSICGASAIAAMQGVARAEEEEVAFSIALVTLCGSLAIVVLPLLQAPLDLGVEAFGLWVGASVHDVGQVVAAASVAGPLALEAAVIVKLSRVVLLGPLVLATGLTARRTAPDSNGEGTSTAPPLLPLFVQGFMVAVALRSSGLVPMPVIDALRVGEQLVLTAALFGLGTDVRLVKLRALGGRPLLLGLLSWILIAAAAYAGVRAAAGS